MSNDRLPCPDCGSGRGMSSKEGWLHCFKCGKNTPMQGTESPAQTRRRTKGMGAPLLEKVPARPLTGRKLSIETCNKFGYFVTQTERDLGGISAGTKVQVAPYHDEAGRVVAQKCRDRNKDMGITGKMPSTLFGQHLWKSGKRIIITEGEIDALSVFEMMGDWPVVSVPNGAQSAAAACAAQLDFLEGFEQVVICMDQDEPGQAAADEIAQLLRPGKAYIMSFSEKDANDMLVEGKNDEFRRAYWNAREYKPEGLVDAIDLWDQVSAPEEPAFFKYPWPGVEFKLKGARKAELVLWCAGSGVGKSTATREVTYAAIQQGIKTGVIALEESVRDTIRHQMSLDLDKPLHVPGADVPDDVLRGSFDRVAPHLVVHDHWGSLDPTKLVNLIRYMVVGKECQMIILDHVSMVVSGNESDNERKDLDILMTRLRETAEDLQVNIQVVSHIKRLDGNRKKLQKTDLRGSASLEQLSDQIVALERDDQDDEDSNITEVRILKNRPFGWLVGSAAHLEYHQSTGRLIEYDGDLEPDNEDTGF